MPVELFGPADGAGRPHPGGDGGDADRRLCGALRRRGARGAPAASGEADSKPCPVGCHAVRRVAARESRCAKSDSDSGIRLVDALIKRYLPSARADAPPAAPDRSGDQAGHLCDGERDSLRRGAAGVRALVRAVADARVVPRAPGRPRGAACGDRLSDRAAQAEVPGAVPGCHRPDRPRPEIRPAGARVDPHRRVRDRRAGRTRVRSGHGQGPSRQYAGGKPRLDERSARPAGVPLLRRQHRGAARNRRQPGRDAREPQRHPAQASPGQAEGQGAVGRGAGQRLHHRRTALRHDGGALHHEPGLHHCRYSPIRGALPC